MTWTDPYHRLGLVYNPFCVNSRPSEIPNHLWLDRGFSQPPPIQSNRFLQIIGEPGAGKTSHLNHWRSQTGGDYTYYPREVMQRWNWPAIGPIAYWDEVDRMPLPLLLTGLMIAKQQNSTIVAGTHKCLRWAAKLMGFQVETIILPQLTCEELLQWADQRISAARLDDSAQINLKLTHQESIEIVQQSYTSWRQAANLLHIWAAQRADRAQPHTIVKPTGVSS